MDDADIASIKYAIECWSDSGRVEWGLQFLPQINVDQTIQRLPAAMVRELGAFECIRNPPKTVDDFFLARSSNSSCASFIGLSEEEALKKIRDEDQNFKQHEFLRYWAFHDYFYGKSKDPASDVS